MDPNPPIEDLARKWILLDHDDTTKQEIEDLLHNDDKSELERRLRKRIAFGTAGLRASMKAGFAHMNPLTVLQASHGLAQYILDSNASSRSEKLAPPSVVVGYDARHNSEKFARLAAAAFLQKGFQILWFGRLVHTPMVPFAVKHYKAAAGVMVTASHNPKNDNGYKVYWNNGCQIIPPHDHGIASAIDTVEEVDTWDTLIVDSSKNVTNVYQDVSKAYFQSIQNHVSGNEEAGSVPPFVYTPLHGVGMDRKFSPGYNSSLIYALTNKTSHGKDGLSHTQLRGEHDNRSKSSNTRPRLSDSSLPESRGKRST
jgi:phosphoglucomutase